jgi:hypothetical protein
VKVSERGVQKLAMPMLCLFYISYVELLDGMDTHMSGGTSW